MNTRQEVLDSMINDYKTTMKHDYRENKIIPVIKTVYQDKKPSIRDKWIPVKYVHTMRNWDGERAPFDFTITTKAILRTNPHHIQPVYEKPKDLELESVRKTRPRLVMTPSISMDDIKDKEVPILLLPPSSPPSNSIIRSALCHNNIVLLSDLYMRAKFQLNWKPGSGLRYSKWNLLMNNSYTTRMTTDYKPVTDVSNVVAPLLGKYSPTSPLTIAKYKQPYVSPEWRMESMSWDRRQIRDYCDANKVFWLYAKPKRNMT